MHFGPYIELVRDVYLAFLLFTFFYLMFSYMAYDTQTVILKHKNRVNSLMTIATLLWWNTNLKFITYGLWIIVLKNTSWQRIPISNA